MQITGFFWHGTGNSTVFWLRWEEIQLCLGGMGTNSTFGAGIGKQFVLLDWDRQQYSLLDGHGQITVLLGWNRQKLYFVGQGLRTIQFFG